MEQYHLSPFKKPREGESCNGCGYCCSIEPCQIAVEFLGAGTAGVCPALEKDAKSGATACGMIKRPLDYLLDAHWSGESPRSASIDAKSADSEEANAGLSRAVSDALGAGQGCDAEDDEHSIHWPWAVMLSV